MIRKNEVLRQALQRETLKYYESYTYNVKLRLLLF